MNPAQLIRALGQVSHLAGLSDRQAELAELEDRATLDDVVELLDELAEAASAARPPVKGANGEERRPPRGRAIRVLALAEQGLTDPQIAAELGMAVDAVRSTRRRHGAVAQAPGPQRSGWEDRMRECLARGLSDDEIADETGWARKTVQQYRYRLRQAAGEVQARGAWRAELAPLLERGLSVREIAAETGWDERTVYRRRAAIRGLGER